MYTLLKFYLGTTVLVPLTLPFPPEQANTEAVYCKYSMMRVCTLYQQNASLLLYSVA